MMKLFFSALLFAVLIFTPFSVFAQENSFVSVVNPIRGQDYWELKNQKVEDAVLGQIKILDDFKTPATWLIRFDVLGDNGVIQVLNERSKDEKGLFLEVTPTWTQSAEVKYRASFSWHSAGSAFLSGYELEEREKLVDQAFEKFKSVFGFFPKSVGAWWIDAHSLSYMQQKYGVSSALIVADQYSTDNYQIWGQFWSTPYYPSKTNALHPAQSTENKIPVVITQWASRDPVNGYGNSVLESTFSVQANDYMDYHNLNSDYFSSLVDVYLKQKFNKFNQLVVGLENSYDWNKYQKEYQNQIKTLADKRNNKELLVVTLVDFADWYQKNFSGVSPTQIIIAKDPLGSFKQVVWFMNPYYRVGWFVNKDGSVFRDIRQYIAGEEELCFKHRCDSVNFATFATRVLDEVSFGHKWTVDEGKIHNFNIKRLEDKYVISYKNEAEKERIIEFLPRDIGVDGKILSIDKAILDATKDKLEQGKKRIEIQEGSFEWSFASVAFKISKFLLFLLVGCITPGYLLINKLVEKRSIYQKISLSVVLGFVLFTIIFYVLGFLNLQYLIYFYLFINLIFLIVGSKPLIKSFKLSLPSKLDLGIIVTILFGTLFQQLPAFKNGLSFPFGLGFWGPNTHDGIWHISLINQLIEKVPPQNPIYAGEVLKNYHFFYDLLVAATNYVSGIPILDLVFRFYPITFSLILGIGTYYLFETLFDSSLSKYKLKTAAIFSLYLVYFAGSFGWIVEFIKTRQFAGESAFWANQSISFNLNPPFAISLLIVIAILQLLHVLDKKNIILITAITLLAGSLIFFKAYAGILILLAFLLTGIIKRSLSHLIIFSSSLVFSVILFFSNFTVGEKLIIFSPFWFIHSMIDSPDRVGWVRLSLARATGVEQGNWFKFIIAETVGFLLFLFGNLGVRFIALFSLFKIRFIIKNNQYLFIFLVGVLSLLVPTLFIQAGNPWNTVQFVYYGLYVAALVSGIVVVRLFEFNNVFKKTTPLGVDELKSLKMTHPARRGAFQRTTALAVVLYRVVMIILTVVFVLITPINSWSTAKGYLNYAPHGLISNQEVEALNFLESKEKGVVLTYPYDFRLKEKYEEPWPLYMYDSTAYVSALSKKPSFLEDQPQNEILLTDYKKRIVGARDFFSGQNSQSNGFIRNNNIKYIYIPKDFNVSLDESALGVSQIFENDMVLIYQVIN